MAITDLVTSSVLRQSDTHTPDLDKPTICDLQHHIHIVHAAVQWWTGRLQYGPGAYTTALQSSAD